MGLAEDEPQQPRRRIARAWLLPGVAIAVALLAELAGESGRNWLRYERAAIAGGEVWRLLTAHFVHLGWSHLGQNVAGLLLIAYLVLARFSSWQWVQIALLTIAAIDAGFWWFEPQLEWYVGLSGLLHGLLVAGIAAGLLRRRPEAWLLGLVVVAKLVYEQFVGPVPGSAEAAGGPVVVAAHLYGAIGGAVTGAAIAVKVRDPAS